MRVFFFLIYGLVWRILLLILAGVLYLVCLLCGLFYLFFVYLYVGIDFCIKYLGMLNVFIINYDFISLVLKVRCG